MYIFSHNKIVDMDGNTVRDVGVHEVDDSYELLQHEMVLDQETYFRLLSQEK